MAGEDSGRLWKCLDWRGSLKYMKTSSMTGRPDTKIHVRKKVAGGATGALVGGAVGGPFGAVVGGALGTLIGKAAEEGRSLPMPRGLKTGGRRSAGAKVQARARRKTARNGSAGSAGAK